MCVCFSPKKSHAICLKLGFLVSTWNRKNIFTPPKGYASICWNLFEIFSPTLCLQIILIFMIRDYLPYMSSVVIASYATWTYFQLQIVSYNLLKNHIIFMIFNMYTLRKFAVFSGFFQFPPSISRHRYLLLFFKPF